MEKVHPLKCPSDSISGEYGEYRIRQNRSPDKTTYSCKPKAVNMSNTADTKYPKVEWKNLDWRKAEFWVFKLQKRIYRASQKGDKKLLHQLQKTLTNSWFAKLIAVRRVTQENKGKNTAGVDGIKSLTPQQRLKLAQKLKINGKTRPTKRVWIPKPGKKENRPLGIPTIEDRAKQTLLKMAIEPEWEAKFESNSYGFRPGRSCHDALQAIRISISKSPKYVLDADISKGKVKLPSLGWIKIRQSREYPVGFTPKQFQIVRKASGYYLMIVFQSHESVPDAVPGKVSIGIDAGIESFIATPSELIKSPKFLRSQLRKLKLLQRRLKKKIKGSNNWLRLQKKIAKFQEKIANTRGDWHFKLAHYLCDQADNIFVEDINFKSWAKGLLCKQSLDSGIGGFINEVLPFVCWKRGKHYLKVDKNGTSQECSNCGQHTGKKDLSERIHFCQFCNHTESRDINSAKIIRDRGLVAVGHPVQKKVCGDGLAGVVQLSLFDLAKSLKQESPVTARR